MRHHLFADPAETYPVVLLSRSTAFNKGELATAYVAPLAQRGVAADQVMAVTLAYETKSKASVKFIKAQLATLLPELASLGAKLLYVADAAYFKVLAGQTKAEPHYGYVLPCKIPGYETLDIVLGLNYQALIYNPALQDKLDLSLDTVATRRLGTYAPLGGGILHSAQYPATVAAIAAALDSLHQHPRLACDIEGFSLRFQDAGIGTIAFAWDQHNGIAFACDYRAAYQGLSHQDPAWPGANIPNPEVRRLLRDFFTAYRGELVFHHAPYDVKALIYTLWMDNLLDTRGLLTGLEILTRRLHDTKIMAYLATNSTAGNVLGLKSLAHAFAGNWAKDDIKDIRKIPLPELLQYNLVDGVSTQYVFNKTAPVLVADNQDALYRDLFLPSLKTIIQMEMTGMPLSQSKVAKARQTLEAIVAKHLAVLEHSPVIKTLELLLGEQAWEADYASRKAKAKNPGKILPKERAAFAHLAFNPNSGPQLQKLLHDMMGLPVVDYTETRQPATGADTLEKLIHHTQNPDYKAVLSALIGYGEASKILTTFIPAFEQAIAKGTGDIVWLHGSFNLGGTVSGRLSSSDPNLQNIPANSTYAALIKECFVAPLRWIFCGADFSSLEDRVNALLTRDPNKIKVYTDGYDGHALRAVAYFGDQMPDINPAVVASVNAIAEKGHPYYGLRQDSKAPTFALTFQGTWKTLVKNLGWTEEKAKQVEANYHRLYAESTRWVKARIAQAAKDGYAEGAFGLRIRTPLLAQTLLGNRGTPREAEAEARTLGNAISGQSYGLLNSRAMNRVMEDVWASPYRHDILPVAQIHDAGYYLVKDDAATVAWLNARITCHMAWQDLPELRHPQVKLGAQLDLFWPNWAHPITLPETASAGEIQSLVKATLAERDRKARQAALKQAA
jgi:DNA polymerase-1